MNSGRPQKQAVAVALGCLLLLSGCAFVRDDDRLDMMADSIEFPVEEFGPGAWRLEGLLYKNDRLTPYGRARIAWECAEGREGKIGRCTDPQVRIDYGTD